MRNQWEKSLHEQYLAKIFTDYDAQLPRQLLSQWSVEGASRRTGESTDSNLNLNLFRAGSPTDLPPNRFADMRI